MLLDGAGYGGRDPRVRADLVFYETGFGGAVMSVGSIAWSNALMANGYDNDVARLTTNTLQRLAAPEPFALPR
jgi:N,N-dimethylformamidase